MIKPKLLVDTIKRVMASETKRYPTEAVVVAVDQNLADISIGHVGRIRNVEIQGNPSFCKVGHTVTINWVRKGSGYMTPVIVGGSAGPVPTSEVRADNKTLEEINGILGVKVGGIGPEHLNFDFAGSDSNPLPGWILDRYSGNLISATGEACIYPSGQISLGLGSNIIFLSGADDNYRIWVGNLNPALAPFKVYQDGSITATAGLIAGWTLAASRLSADGGNAILNASSHPYLGLGGATAFAEAGIWLGKDVDNVYKLYVGNPLADHMYWDGASLVITGTFAGVTSMAGSGSATWKINEGLADVTSKLIFGRTTGGNAEISWDGVALALSANAQGQTIVGLQADKLNKSIIAGNGLTGGGLLTADATLNIVAGTGISVAADAISLDLAVVPTWTGAHTFNGNIISSLVRPRTTDAYDIGAANYLYRQAWISQLNSVIFAQQTATLVGGWLIVGKNEGKLAAAVSAAASAMDFGQAMTLNDFVVIRAQDTSGNLKTEYVKVGTLVSGNNYNVTRDVAAANATDPAWAKGVVYSVLGNDGNGRVEINAYDTPRISIIRQGTTYNGTTELVRMGDLNGWGPVATELYGWAVGDFVGNKFAYYTPTLGLIVRGDIRADAGYLGTLSIDGVLSLGTAGGIYQGSGTFATPTTGLKIWNDSGIGRIAGYNASVLQWYANTDGTFLAGAGGVVLSAAGVRIDNAAKATAKFIFGAAGAACKTVIHGGAITDPAADHVLTFSMEDGVAYPNNNGTYIYMSSAAYGGTNNMFNIAHIAGDIATHPFYVDKDALVHAPLLTSNQIDLGEVAAPATPASGLGRFYNQGGLPVFLNDDGISMKMAPLYFNMDLTSCLLYGSSSKVAVPSAGGLWGLQCNPTTEDGAFMLLRFPPGFASRTIRVAIFWCPATTAAGNVVHQIAWWRINSGETLGGGVGGTQPITVASPGIVNRVVKTEFTVTNGTLLEEGAINIRLARQGQVAGDTYAGVTYMIAASVTIDA